MRALTLTLQTLLLVVFSHPALSAPPNIVFILADDLGYGDLQIYSGFKFVRDENGNLTKSHTPNLDDLADAGVRFTRFYVTGATCNPSRVGLMTGRHPATFALYPSDYGLLKKKKEKDAINNLISDQPALRDVDDPYATTISQLLKNAGYATGHFGKWHLGPETYSLDNNGNRIFLYGFDEVVARAGKKGDPCGRDARNSRDAIDFISRKADADERFYVNIWLHATHSPVSPRINVAECKKTNYGEDMENVDIAGNTDVFSGDDFAIMRSYYTGIWGNEDIKPRMEKYLWDVWQQDYWVGQIVNKLREKEIDQNTIIIYASDNGPGVAEDASDNMLGFAGDGDGSLRGRKHGFYEGGIRMPLLVSWPGKVDGGRVDKSHVVSGVDFLLTLSAAAGLDIGEIKKDVRINDGVELDGENLLNLWRTGTGQRAKPLYWRKLSGGGESAILAVDGILKLYRSGYNGKGKLKDPSALYNVRDVNTRKEEQTFNDDPSFDDMASRLDGWLEKLPQCYYRKGKVIQCRHECESSDLCCENETCDEPPPPIRTTS